MRTLSRWAAGLLITIVAMLASYGAASAIAQGVSSGGAFLPLENYQVSGQWLFKRTTNPVCFEGSTDDANETCITVTDPTGDRAWTLQNATDTLVGRATTDTLTNKTLTSPTLTTPALGVATGTSLAVTGALSSSSASAGIGYATGAGCAVTQATNRTTGVTCTGVSGAITTNTASLAAEATAKFTVTNTSVAIGDTVVVSQRSGSDGGGTIVHVTTVAAGSFQIAVYNGNVAAGTAETGAIVINFAVIKAVSS